LSQLINKKITGKTTLVIDEDGVNLGKMSVDDALQLAQSKELDLVEVGPGVCKIQNYQKFLYAQKKANKSKPAPSLKEFQFKLNIAFHDMQVKANHINELLVKGHPIRLVIKFYGRENAHPEKGQELLKNITSLLTGAIVDSSKQEGNQIIAMVRKEKS
jgi:translation initiation factor IF-3